MNLPTSSRCFAALAVIIAGLAASPAAHAQTTTPPAQAASGFVHLSGFVLDSLDNGPLAGAQVRVEGLDAAATTGPDGSYAFDSIPAGNRRMAVLHPLLDTLGIALITRPFTFVAGKAAVVNLTVPTAERLAAALCSPALLARGPAALVGFVKDPDTGLPATGAKVSLVYYESPPMAAELGALAGKVKAATKVPRVREAIADSLGRYRICGLPGNMEGKVQVFRDGISSGEVPAAVENGFLATHSFSIASQVRVSTITDTAGKSRRVYAGDAVVTGRIVNRAGQPLAGARVTMDGTTALAISRSNGDFVLDSLPSGTQSLTVRKLGYSATYEPVETSASTPQRVTIAMNDFVPTLAAMRTEAQAIQGLEMVGYLDRKRAGTGVYLDGSKLDHAASGFTEMLRTVPGIRLTPSGDGMHYRIVPTRGQSGCVNIYLDGNLWRQMSPGDIDGFVQPAEVAAIEVYTTSSAPIEFTPPGSAGCTTIVAWTSFTANRQRKP
jgi:hypothetical protein